MPGSLLILAWSGLPPRWMSVLVAVSFSVLSLLPAVLLQILASGPLARADRRGVPAKRDGSGDALLGDRRERRGSASNRAAGDYGRLPCLAIAAVPPLRCEREPGGIRHLASMCLALFAMSFVHFGTGHASQVWSSEVLVHHIGIPLALLVLLQDYRFVLLDAFVRFLANALWPLCLAER